MTRPADVADWLTGGGLVIAMLSSFAAYSPWPLGVWPKVEPTILQIHAGALLCAVGLFAGIVTNRAIALAALMHPLVLICLAIASWSALVAPFSRYPLLSIIGSPQLADGIVLWLDVAVFIAGVRMLASTPVGLAAIGGVTAFTALLLPLLAVHPATRAIWFNDYLAFLGLAAAVIVPVCLARQITSTGRRLLLAAACGAPAIAVSQNISGFVFVVCLGGSAFMLTAFAMKRKHGALDRFAAWGAATAIGALALAMPFAIAWIGGSGGPKSLVSRALIDDVLLQVFAKEPSAWIFGKGWAHTQIYFSELLALTDATIWNKEWDAAWRDIFHSHNFLLEGLVSAGIPAAIGLLCLVICVPLTCRANWRPYAVAFGLGYAGLASFWFQMPGTVPFTAAAFALISGDSPVRGMIRAKAVFISCFLAAALLGQGTALYLLTPQARHAGKIAAAFASPDGNYRPKCGDFPEEDWRGHPGLNLQLTRAFNAFKDVPENESNELALQALEFYACTATRRGKINPSSALLHAGLLFRAEVAYARAFAPVQHRFAAYLEDWEKLVRDHLRLSPNRTDLVLPFLSWKLAQNKNSIVLELTTQILRRNSADPVGSWFQGIALLRDGEPENKTKALKYLQLALDNGIEKWLPVSPETKRIIEGGSK